MCRRSAARQQAERLALAVIEAHGAPIELREVALALGWRCQKASRVLSRLAAMGEVLREIVEFKDACWRPRQRFLYRPCPKSTADLPAWLSPPVYEVLGARRVTGRYSVG